MTAIPVAGLDHVVVRARDLANMQRFYEGLFDISVERRIDRIGLVQLRIGAHLLDLIQDRSSPGQATGRNMDHFCVQVDPWDDAGIRAHLDDLGIEAGPTERRYGAGGYGPSIYLTDPEGNLVELKGPAEPEDTTKDNS